MYIPFAILLALDLRVYGAFAHGPRVFLGRTVGFDYLQVITSVLDGLSLGAGFNPLNDVAKPGKPQQALSGEPTERRRSCKHDQKFQTRVDAAPHQRTLQPQDV